jgi:crossover junction endodeoxyribonuclease RusA
VIELPFPPATLSPNARPHWAQRARAFKSYKMQCYMLLSQFRDTLAGRDTFSVTFHPPTAHRFDADNLVSRFKAGQDALAEIAGVDDSQFVMTYRKGSPVKGGAVVIA